MLMLAVALTLFIMAHLAPAAPGVRPRLVKILGERGYLVVYSAISLALLLWVAMAAIRAPAVILWPTFAFAHVIPIATMPFAFMLIGAGLAAPNPLSVSLSTAQFDPRAPGVVGFLRHPVLWGFGLWAASHIPPNGVLAQALFFVAMTVFAIAGARRLDVKRQRSLGVENWNSLDKARGAPFFKCLIDKRTLIGAAISLLLYAGFLAAWHKMLFGVEPLWLLLPAVDP